MVAEFLEKTSYILRREMDQKPEKAEQVLERLHRILFSNRLNAYDFDEEDIEGADFKEVALLYHDWLKDTWESIKRSIFKYRESILPMAGKAREARELARSVPPTAADSPRAAESTGGIDEFVELASSMIPAPGFFEQYIEQLPMPAIPSTKDQRDAVEQRLAAKRIWSEAQLPTEMPPTRDKLPVLPLVKIVFNGKNLKFVNRLNPIDALLDTLDGLPIDIFRECPQCARCFVETRIGKMYCTHVCAARAVQKRRWDEDREGSREKERIRYRNRRKRVLASDTEEKDGQ
jgi:ferredoxin